LVQDKIFGSCKKELPFELTYSSTADTGGQWIPYLYFWNLLIHKQKLLDLI
jgi:hypothetical protein